MAKKVQFTTNQPSATTDYLAADNTWKTIPGGGSGIPKGTTSGMTKSEEATADADMAAATKLAEEKGIEVHEALSEIYAKRSLESEQ